MPRYKIEIEEINYGFTYVDVDDPSEIEEIANEAWFNNDYYWKGGSLNILGFEEIKGEE